MSVIEFDIRLPGGQRESALIEGERALIGSGSHCDVRLPMDQAAYEHVLVEAVGGTLRVEAKADKPPVTLNGMPLTAGALAADSVLGIGRIRLFVRFVASAADGASAASQKRKSASSSLLRLGLVMAFGAAAYLLLMVRGTTIDPAPAEAPELFPAARASCPQTDTTQALAFAQEQNELANGKRERGPFHISDGVAAVGFYQTAVACYRQGGAEPQARDAEAAAKSLERDLTNDFRARRLRLSQMLKVQDYELARKDLAVLIELTQGKKGSYVEWLAATSKQLAAKN